MYAAWEQRWLDDILGSNAWGVSLIVGDGTVYPDCMQHQVANLAGSLDGQPPVLAGADQWRGDSSSAYGHLVPHEALRGERRALCPGCGVQRQKAAFAEQREARDVLVEAAHRPHRAAPPLAFAWQQHAAR